MLNVINISSIIDVINIYSERIGFARLDNIYRLDVWIPGRFTYGVYNRTTVISYIPVIWETMIIKSECISSGYWITINIGINIDSAPIADRVAVDPPSDVRVIVPVRAEDQTRLNVRVVSMLSAEAAVRVGESGERRPVRVERLGVPVSVRDVSFRRQLVLRVVRPTLVADSI